MQLKDKDTQASSKQQSLVFETAHIRTSGDALYYYNIRVVSGGGEGGESSPP